MRHFSGPGDRAITSALSDALSTLRWGVRHYALLFTGCMLVGLVALPLVLIRGTGHQATALVVAQRWDRDLTALPAYAEGAFDNGPVASAIAAQFGNVGDVQDIVPHRVSLHTEPASIILRVTGHAASAGGAADLANAAAAAFVAQLNEATAGGSFGIQSLAFPPMTDNARPMTVAVVLGIGLSGGLALGVGVIALLLLVRRPVLGAWDAAEITGTSVLGAITLPRLRDGTAPRPQDVGVLVAVCRRLLADAPRVVLVTSAGSSVIRRRQVSLTIAALLSRIASVRVVTEPPDRIAWVEGAESGAPATPGRQITIVDGPSPSVVTDPVVRTAVILLVPFGVSEQALRSAADRHLAGAGLGHLLMVRSAVLGRNRA